MITTILLYFVLGLLAYLFVILFSIFIIYLALEHWNPEMGDKK